MIHIYSLLSEYSNTVYGKTFEWENFCGQYANDHSRLPSAKSFVLRETYKITYSAKIHGKIFTIECKIVKTAKILLYTVLYFDILIKKHPSIIFTSCDATKFVMFAYHEVTFQ